MKFSKLRLSDKDLFEKYLRRDQTMTSVADFATIYEWDIQDCVEYAIEDDSLIVRNIWADEHIYYCPYVNSEQQIRSIIERIADLEEGSKHSIAQIPEAYVPYLQDLQGYHAITHDRDYSDYIYEVKSLVTLSGKSLHAKRNHLNKFKASYPNYIFRDYESDDFQALVTMTNEWMAKAESADSAEKTAIVRALTHLETLQMQCGILQIDDQIAAFGIVSRNINNVGQVHFEKAKTEYEGAYTAINQMCAEKYLSACAYINRQEDMGIEGLRKAKLSYKPFLILPKYRLKSL